MRNQTSHVTKVIVTSVLLILLASCTSYIGDAPASPGIYVPQDQQDYDPAANSPVEPSAESEPLGQLEEVIVTAQKRSRDRNATYRRRPDTAAQILSKRKARAKAKPVPRKLIKQHIPSTVMPGEELWIIAKNVTVDDPSTQHADMAPGSGAMVARSNKNVPLPLEHTAVSADIDGYISTVNVRQTFANPFSTKIEAVYMFPLPEKAAVNEFVMVIGERKIRGILRDKDEAQAIYKQAKAQGYRASLLVQHRPNIFEQKVANIEPGKKIAVDIKYFHTLAYRDGWYEFVFPTVIGPRFNPPASADPIKAIPNNSASLRAQTSESSTAVTYLRPGQRSGHDISIDVNINAGSNIERLTATHTIESKQMGETTSVRLQNNQTIPNRDFILKFAVAGDTIKSQLLTHFDESQGEGYFSLMVYPPANIDSTSTRTPMEMVFVLDCSGSMAGAPLRQAKAAVRAGLAQLKEQDTFQIVRFSDNASKFGGQAVPATRANIKQAQRYLASLNGTGGTMMVEGMKTALNFPHDPSRLRFVSFMTDGYIGNEAQVLKALNNHIGSARVFSFGVGSSVNRYLLERMAKVGRGAAAFLGPNDAGSKIMNNFFKRVSHPALIDLSIDWGGMIVSDVYPAQLPDLFVGRPVFVTGKYVGSTDRISIRGTADNEHRWTSVDVNPHQSQPNLPQIWARLKIAELSDALSTQGDPYQKLSQEIKATALAYQLMSKYTSFVAVDASRITDGTFGVTVQQPVPVPSGVRYDTTVPEG